MEPAGGDRVGTRHSHALVDGTASPPEATQSTVSSGRGAVSMTKERDCRTLTPTPLLRQLPAQWPRLTTATRDATLCAALPLVSTHLAAATHQRSSKQSRPASD